MIDEPALPHRALTIQLDDPTTAVAARTQISSALRWRNACDAHQLLLNVRVTRPAGLAELATVVRHVDAEGARHRDRCTLRIYCSFPENVEQLVDQLAAADTRAPRIEVIRLLDRPLEPSRLAQLTREAESAESSQLLFWAYFELASTDQLEQLIELIGNEALASCNRVALRRFPIVEIPGPFSMDDAEPIARFWSLHPQLQDAATRSLHGRVSAFFRLFEIARLVHAGVELPPISGDLESDDRRCLPEFCEWLNHNGLMTAEPRLESVILEHDVDLLADSHECQSPVFTFAGVSTYVEAVKSAEYAS